MMPGDPIWYRQTQRGGYGFTFDVPGTYVRHTDRRTIVRLHRKDGTLTTVAVLPKNVRLRDPDAVWRT